MVFVSFVVVLRFVRIMVKIFLKKGLVAENGFEPLTFGL